MKRRVLIVLVGVVVMLLASIAPAGAIDPPDVSAILDMPDGSVQIIDYIFDINIVFDESGNKFVDLRLPGGTEINGIPGTAIVIVKPDGDGGGVCVPGECD